MIKQLSFFLAIIALSQSFIWLEGPSFFQDTQLPINFSFSGWSSVESGFVDQNAVTSCGSVSIYGGFERFGLDHEILYDQNNFLLGAPHDYIRVSFKMWQLDSWGNTDFVELFIDSQPIKVFTKDNSNPLASDICGLNTGDQVGFDLVEDFVVILPHTSNDIVIRFQSQFDSPTDDESWGINNFLIEYNPVCPAGQTYQNGECVDIAVAQACYDELAELDPSPTQNQSVSNDCDWEEVNGEHIYTFNIEYIGLYQHDENCVDQKLYFGGNLLTEGTSTNNNNEWEYNAPTITFRVKHSELVSDHNCVFSTEASQFVWTCQVQLDICYNGYVQLSYQYTFCVYLPRSTDAETIVEVFQNTVIEEDCCINTLNVDSILEICTDTVCSGTLPTTLLNPAEFERGSQITVRHSITTVEFQIYYLDIKQFTYGPFTPVINNYDGSNTGFTIITFTPNVAMNGIFINSVAQLSEVPSIGVGRRRVLQQQQDDDANEEQFQAQYQISVKDPKDMQIQQDVEQLRTSDSELIEEEKETQRQYQNLMITVGILGTIILLSIVASLFYCKKNFTLKQKAMETRKAIYQEEPQSQERKLNFQN